VVKTSKKEKKKLKDEKNRRKDTEDNYFRNLIIERIDRRDSPFGEYRARWEEGGNYLEKSYARLVDDHYILYYMGRDFGVENALSAEDADKAERRLYEKIRFSAVNHFEFIKGIYNGKGVFLEDRTKYAEKK